MDHLSDKELMRQGRYAEALGQNYVVRDIYLLDFINGRKSDPIHVKGKKGKDKYFYSKEEAHKYGEKHCVDYMLCSLNADWL